MPKLIEGFADRLQVPAGTRDIQVFDDELPGFGIRKFARGHASYFVKFNVGPQQRRKTLGKVIRGNLKSMRLQASEILAKARLGTDVVAVAKASASKRVVTLEDLIPRYLVAREGDLRPRSITEIGRYLEGAWSPLHALSIDVITRQNIVGVIDGLEHASGKVAADRARMALSGLFAWAIDRGYLDVNPCLGIKARAQSKSRERVLSEKELASVWKACLDDDYGRIVRLLILTGQRRTELGDLRWSEIDLQKHQIELPASRTKNGRAHIVPLSHQALVIIEATYSGGGRDLVFGRGAGGFSGWSKAKSELDCRIAVNLNGTTLPSWTLHDLRRSLVTHISELGFAHPHVAEAVVNHISGSKAGVAGVYNRATYLNEKRQALNSWGTHMAALVNSMSNVVRIRA